MDKRLIKIRMLHSEIEGMCHAYEMVNPSYGPENQHECLLLEMAMDMQERLRRMATKQQERYTVAINNTEALAFYQYWQSIQSWPIPVYSANAVQKIFGVLDRKSKQARL